MRKIDIAALDKETKIMPDKQMNDKTTTKDCGQEVVGAGASRRGNPQIAKAEGDVPVQAYIAAMPNWKSDLGRRFDVLIACARRQSGILIMA
ncbi:hypothetical protein S1OALGB6SA_646 [Olavius algarvensis spirochete endosymbiont]|uniref:hypothetical protein n=1 Tax=Olavius algarvensis spirochete endosymbiont TaxID=260710 RepID=UPI000F2B0131|nr:hypothetical protein [Olavius algarvensis spirochete endosymbiont]VDA99576.1 hypothetical protein S1OALGB6SA_646 [Olavius algarvensis spirochete endosymbiont]